MKSTVFKLIPTLKQLAFFLIIFISIVNHAIADSSKIEDLERELIYKVSSRNWQAVITIADELFQYTPKHPEVHFRKGQALAALGRYEEAIASFDLAIKYKFYYLGWVYYEKGNSLRALKMLEEALTCYNKAIKLGLKDHWVYSDRDEVLMKLDRLDEGLDHI